ncbi:MAG: thiamine diphosphokinase [Synergistaceae bacterium]|nr:thiamine diphosphokinase [Synergistaceae bacterium]
MKSFSSFLSLPQMDVAFDQEVDVQLLLVLGGRAPEPAWLNAVVSARVVWVADRGAEACRIAGIVPHHAVGDFDSIGEEGEEWLKRLGVETECYPADKDLTDFQLCLEHAAGKNVLVTGCWGGRFDHAFANVFSALWGGVSVRAFADESEVLIPLLGPGGLTFSFRTRPLAFSLLPLCGACEGVTLRGTKWGLDGAELLQNHPCAVSNVAVQNHVTISVKKGALGIYCFFGNG